MFNCFYTSSFALLNLATLFFLRNRFQHFILVLYVLGVLIHVDFPGSSRSVCWRNFPKPLDIRNPDLQ